MQSRHFDDERKQVVNDGVQEAEGHLPPLQGQSYHKMLHFRFLVMFTGRAHASILAAKEGDQEGKHTGRWATLLSL